MSHLKRDANALCEWIFSHLSKFITEIQHISSQIKWVWLCYTAFLHCSNASAIQQM